MDKSLDKLRLECEELKTLIPRQLSHDLDSPGSPLSPDHRLARLVGLEDLDLLPTKEGPSVTTGRCVSLCEIRPFVATYK